MNISKISIVLAACFAGMTSTNASDDLYSIGFEYGEGRDDVESYQFNYTRDISDWVDRRVWNIGKYGVETDLELTAFLWDSPKTNEELFGGSVGVNLEYEFKFGANWRLTPYVEYGFGLSLISDTSIATRNMSSAFHFKNQMGIGLKASNFDFFIRGAHFSNAGIAKPNVGMDIVSAGIRFKF